MQTGFTHNALLIAAQQHLWKIFPHKTHAASISSSQKTHAEAWVLREHSLIGIA
jgi:hypothetical protein